MVVDECEHGLTRAFCTPCETERVTRLRDDGDAGGWLTAKHDGVCLQCGEWIEAGVSIIRWSEQIEGYVCWECSGLAVVDESRARSIALHPSTQDGARIIPFSPRQV